jgi:hypothetical protein
MGLPSGDNTAPMSTPLASQSNSKGWAKFGKVRIGARVITLFKVLKAVVASGLHEKHPFFMQSVIGLVIVLKPWMNLL